MLGEPNERKDIDEETALEPDARYPSFHLCYSRGYVADAAIHVLLVVNWHSENPSYLHV
jgi:hypothetical protein